MTWFWHANCMTSLRGHRTPLLFNTTNNCLKMFFGTGLKNQFRYGQRVSITVQFEIRKQINAQPSTATCKYKFWCTFIRSIHDCMNWELLAKDGFIFFAMPNSLELPLFIQFLRVNKTFYYTYKINTVCMHLKRFAKHEFTTM